MKEGLGRNDSNTDITIHQLPDAEFRVGVSGGKNTGRDKQETEMTPYQLARQECANMLSDGSCENIDIRNGVLIPGKPRKTCLVRDGLRCEYFERLILPLVRTASDRRAVELQSACDEYHQKHTSPGVQGKMWADENISSVPCPDCGGEKPKGRTRCPTCAVKRKRKLARDRKEKQRKSSKDAG